MRPPRSPPRIKIARAACRRPACVASSTISNAISVTGLPWAISPSLSGLSPDHFAAQFRRSTGLPPHRYVLQRRVGRAKELVAAGRLSLAEIGYALGFPSQAHFTTTFRKLVGTTPGAYRSAYSPPGNGIVEESRNLPLERERPAALIAATIGGTALNTGPYQQLDRGRGNDVTRGAVDSGTVRDVRHRHNPPGEHGCAGICRRFPGRDPGRRHGHQRHHRRLSGRPVPDPCRHHLPVRVGAEQRHDRLAGPAGGAGRARPNRGDPMDHVRASPLC